MKTNIQYFDQMKESPFLSWFDTTQTGDEVTIDRYELIEIESKAGEIEKKWAVHFQEKQKPLLLNKTNRNTLSQLFGGRLDQSIGKKVTLYFRDDIEFQGKQTKGLRLKPPAKRELITA